MAILYFFAIFYVCLSIWFLWVIIRGIKRFPSYIKNKKTHTIVGECIAMGAAMVGLLWIICARIPKLIEQLVAIY